MPDTLRFTVWLTTTFTAVVSIESPRQFEVFLKPTISHGAAIR